MPIMDGMECTQQIRRLEAQRELVEHVPIIGVTANARKEQIEALFEAGMVGDLFLLFSSWVNCLLMFRLG
jgi:CheY-like chemotaxis protein